MVLTTLPKTNDTVLSSSGQKQQQHLFMFMNESPLVAVVITTGRSRSQG